MYGAHERTRTSTPQGHGDLNTARLPIPPHAHTFGAAAWNRTTMLPEEASFTDWTEAITVYNTKGWSQDGIEPRAREGPALQASDDTSHP